MHCMCWCTMAGKLSGQLRTTRTGIFPHESQSDLDLSQKPTKLADGFGRKRNILPTDATRHRLAATLSEIHPEMMDPPFPNWELGSDTYSVAVAACNLARTRMLVNSASNLMNIR